MTDTVRHRPVFREYGAERVSTPRGRDGMSTGEQMTERRRYRPWERRKLEAAGRVLHPPTAEDQEFFDRVNKRLHELHVVERVLAAELAEVVAKRETIQREVGELETAIRVYSEMGVLVTA